MNEKLITLVQSGSAALIGNKERKPSWGFFFLTAVLRSEERHIFDCKTRRGNARRVVLSGARTYRTAV